ncbi:stretch-activated Ca2+-permeable channel component-domain-containing protein [Xylaria sp. CBS 124048]|nr:stretch-activated Ca2+-permeable channel component-domain-containing protein [Xylaria sp. CBS 124048]
MQLSPLQSRLAASAMATCLLIILYVVLSTPPFASATELGPSPVFPDSDDLNPSTEDTVEPLIVRELSYEPEFSLFDRGIIGRASDPAFALGLDSPSRSNIDPGSTNVYVFKASSVSGRSAHVPEQLHELRRSLNVTPAAAAEAEGHGDNQSNSNGGLTPRQEPSKTIFISANTCNQPNRISPNQTSVDPPQLTLFVSTSSNNISPGPGSDQNSQEAIVFDEGAVMFNTSLDHDVHFSISAPQVLDESFSAPILYNYIVAVSLDGYYYSYDDQSQPNLFWVDSDASSAFLTTQNLTSDPQAVIAAPPYQVFVQGQDNLGINGLRKSYCGLLNEAQIRPLQSGNSQAMTSLSQGATSGNSTIEEVYITGLNASTNYTGIIALASNANMTLTERQASDSPAKGVVVYNGVDFSTKPNGACTFIFNLTLCTGTRYAVPGNSTNFPNGTALAAFYDNYTQTMYNNFEKVLQQTPCQAPPTQRYSLARDCDDCKQAYKDWLCSVAIPRCEDFSSTEANLQMRNINAPFPNGSFVDPSIRQEHGDEQASNSSRNPVIDEQVQPGPYKELLPCDYLCYELVKSCPASIGFSCPLRSSKYGFKSSYAVHDNSMELSCNYPGSAYIPSAAGVTVVSWMGMAVLLALSLFMTC